jgi:hypothetical protein
VLGLLSPSVRAVDLESVYKSVWDEMETEKSIIMQNTQRLSPYDIVFLCQCVNRRSVSDRYACQWVHGLYLEL